MESIVKYNETLFVILKCCQEFIVSVNLQQRQKVSVQYCRAIPADCGSPGDMPDQGMRVMQISADCDSQGTGHGLAGKSSLDYDGLLDRMGK
jgi:hypothetical protein